jgi:hypothetical protein
LSISLGESSAAEDETEHGQDDEHDRGSSAMHEGHNLDVIPAPAREDRDQERGHRRHLAKYHLAPGHTVVRKQEGANGEQAPHENVPCGAACVV